LNKRIIILLGLVLSMRVLATTVEQEQRFLYYFYEAERLWQAEQYQQAYELFEFCHNIQPNDAMTNQYLGHIYRAMKQPSRALPYYQRAWKAAPTECWLEYAVTLYNMGEDSRKEAIRVMEETSNLAPQNSDLWDHLRDAYLGTGSYKKALKAQDKIDQIDGYDAYSAMDTIVLCLTGTGQCVPERVAVVATYADAKATDRVVVDTRSSGITVGNLELIGTRCAVVDEALGAKALGVKTREELHLITPLGQSSPERHT